MPAKYQLGARASELSTRLLRPTSENLRVCFVDASECQSAEKINNAPASGFVYYVRRRKCIFAVNVAAAAAATHYQKRPLSPLMLSGYSHVLNDESGVLDGKRLNMSAN